MERVLPRKNILGREGYKFYRQNCNKELRSKNINREIHAKIVSAIYRKVAEKMIENKSGVYMKDLGYFCIMMYPKRMMLRKPYSKTGEKYYNLKTDNYPYSPQWIHNMYPQRYFTWTLDRTFSETGIKEPLCKELQSGKKYIMEYKLVRSLKELNSNKNK